MPLNPKLSLCELTRALLLNFHVKFQPKLINSSSNFQWFFLSNNLLCKVIFPAKIPFSKIQKKMAGKIYFAKE
jgi:hypothetical protein